MIHANRVDDLDLWWHLKNGQFIYETLSIPEKDYFSTKKIIGSGLSTSGIAGFPSLSFTLYIC
jgi:hypothetical protein